MRIPGTCLCSAIRYEVENSFEALMHCHCSMCRKHHGALFATYVTAPLAGFRWLRGEERVASYASSAHSERRFCPTCGSVVPALTRAGDAVSCPAGNLEGALAARRQYHEFVGSKAPWFEITDDWPQFEESPPGFAPGVSRAPRATTPGVTNGSCLCGAVTYEAVGVPKRMVHCHCSRCRRGRSAAHATNLAYAVADFSFTSGAENVREYKLPEAVRFGAAFCELCGSAMPRVVGGISIVPGGTLDSDPGARPTEHIFVGSKASWFTITDRVAQFDTVPS